MAHLLECTDLTMRFGGLVALNALEMHVDAGETVGLVGPNGSGKTTFFNVVTGIYRASAGRVVVDGRDITGASPQEVCRAGVTRTFQRSRLCPDLTVFDNIMVGNHTRLSLGFMHNSSSSLTSPPSVFRRPWSPRTSASYATSAAPARPSSLWSRTCARPWP